MTLLRSLAILAALTAGAAQAQVGPPRPAPSRPAAPTVMPPCRPPALVSMTFRNLTPGLQAVDPRAQPKTMWRKGGQFLRTLEQPVVSAALQDAKGTPMARQALVIVAEPDIWLIDTASREGRHSLDKDPALEVRAPIVPLGGAPPEFLALEYGCELEFVALRAPTPKSKVRWGDIDAAIHTYAIGGASLSILMDDQAGRPLMITYVQDGQPKLIVHYDSYERGLPEPPGLFRPPPGVKIQEAPAEAAPAGRSLDRKADAAPAAGLGVRVAHPELGAGQLVHEVDLGALQQRQ